MNKMVIIGAGSMVFTQGLVVDLCRFLNGKSAELALCDTDPQALTAIERLVRKMAEAQQAKLTIKADTDRKRLLPGADYVVSTIGVGGRRAWENDVFIPRKYGVYQPVGDTMMPGGISRAMRMIPAMLDILADVKALCPDAFMFNYANPMAIMTRALRKATDVKVVGLCHGIPHMERYIARTLRLDPARLTAVSVGINHLTFMYDIRYDGADIKPLMHDCWRKNKDAINSAHIGYMDYAPDEKGGAASFLACEPFAWEFFDRYDAFPAPGDRHITEFFTENFPDGRYFGNRLGFKGGFSFEDCIANGDRSFARTQQLALGEDPLPADFFNAFSGEHEQLLDIIASIESDSRRVYSVNLPNEGSVPNLPPYAVLEMPAVAAAKGFRPMRLTDFPDVLAGFINRFLPIIEVTAGAALTGDRNLFAEAILMGGYISDRAAVAKMVDELIEAQKTYLPQF